MAKQRYFRVLAGTHTDEKKKVYKKDDIVASKHNLAEMFLNKFVELKGEDAELAEQKLKTVKSSVEDLDRVKAHRQGGMEVNEGTVEDKSDHPVDTQKLQDGEDINERGDENGEGEENRFGADVTDKFPHAEDGGLRVFKSEEGYTIVDGEDLDTALNDEPFTNQKDAKKFVEKNLKE